MKTVIVLSVVLASCSALAAAIEGKASPYTSVKDNIWKDCTGPQAHGKINSIKVEPSPPTRNSAVSITANVTIDETVTSGGVKVSLEYDGVPLYSNTFSLCDLLKDVGRACPVKQEQFLVLTVSTDKIPDNTPPGDYKGHAEATDQNNQQLFCIDINIRLN